MLIASWCLPYALAVGVGLGVQCNIIMCTHRDTIERDGGWLGCLAIPPYHLLPLHERDRDIETQTQPSPIKQVGEREMTCMRASKQEEAKTEEVFMCGGHASGLLSSPGPNTPKSPRTQLASPVVVAVC
jgi:hypothetical protein